MDIIFVILEVGAGFEIDNAEFTIDGQRVDSWRSMLLANVICQHIFRHKLLSTLLAGELAVTVSYLSFQQILLRPVFGQNVHKQLCEDLKLSIAKLALVSLR